MKWMLHQEVISVEIFCSNWDGTTKATAKTNTREAYEADPRQII
jgi:hypothetical protein